MKTRTKYTLAAVAAVIAVIVVFVSRDGIRYRLTEWTKPAVPPEMPRPTPTPKPSPGAPKASPTPIPDSINLSVPFTTQAPLGVWDADHEEFCEEAASLMAASYLIGDMSITNPAVADARLYELKAWEVATFGYFQDTTAAETTRMLTESLKASPVKLVYNPTVAELEQFLAAGRLVIVPAAGRMLDNPYFTGAGPLYHMVLLKGYTSDTFITNDPGTRHGANYVYPINTIMQAMHDWNGGDVTNGAKVVIVVG